MRIVRCLGEDVRWDLVTSFGDSVLQPQSSNFTFLENSTVQLLSILFQVVFLPLAEERQP